MEKCELKFGIFGIALCKVCVNVRKVDALGDIRLIVAAIDIYHRHDDVHAVNVTQKLTVSAVTETPSCIAHILYPFVNYF